MVTCRDIITRALQQAGIVPLGRTPATLIIHGTHDQIVPHAQGEFLVRHLPKASLSSWQGVGHAPHAHDGERLMAEIMAHRARHGVA